MRRGRPAVALTVIAVSLGAVGLLDALTAPPEVTDPEPVALAGTEVVSGRSVCAVGDDREGTTAVIDLLRPGAAGDPPALAELRTFADGSPEPLLTTRLFPGSGARVPIEEQDDAATEATWSGAPVTVARSWRLAGEEDLPPGTAAGPCAPGTSATSWTVPGLSTEGGQEARLRIANPHGTGATVAVGFLTPEGPDAPTRLRNVSVGPEETVELTLNEYLPEQPDLAVTVAVESGRVAVEGVQLTRNAIGGIDGVSLLQAATEPAQTSTVPLVIDGEGRASWLWIANQADRAAPVELTFHTPEGGIVPEGLAEVDVPPGTVRRIDLRGTLPEGVNTAAVTARSDAVPVTVSAVAQLSGGDPDDTGFAVQLGAAADQVWTLAGNRRPERTEQLRLVNPGSDPATVDVTLWNGSTATQPAELTGLQVPAGSLLVVTFHELVADAPSWGLTVRATEGTVVAGNVGIGDRTGPQHFVAQVGAPSAWWRTPRTPVLRWAPGTAQRLGTELGIEPIDPFATGQEDEEGAVPDELDGGGPPPPAEELEGNVPDDAPDAADGATTDG